MSLDARLAVARDRFEVRAELAAAPGELVALLGPNGAGKSTVVAALAGLLPLRAGRVLIGGRLVDDPAAGCWVPPERRSVGVLFQDHLLFPHLSVLDNVAFGPRCRGLRPAAARAVAAGWLDRLELAELAGVRPHRLSGGQAQRAALARALAGDPALLLLDEPLSALDADTRSRVRADLRHHLDAYAGASVLVTHDVLDALVLADRVVVLEAGTVVQQGTPAELARAPRTDYVARLVGLNLLRGVADGAEVALPGGARVVLPVRAHGPVFVAFPPSAVTVHPGRPEGSARNVWPGRVAAVEGRGDLARVTVAAGLPAPLVADLTASSVAALRLVVGRPVWVSVKATEVACYPA
ncbi:MAG: ABC transporter ATP-binding protein [Actinomycetota bacterium]